MACFRMLSSNEKMEWSLYNDEDVTNKGNWESVIEFCV